MLLWLCGCVLSWSLLRQGESSLGSPAPPFSADVICSCTSGKGKPHHWKTLGIGLKISLKIIRGTGTPYPLQTEIDKSAANSVLHPKHNLYQIWGLQIRAYPSPPPPFTGRFHKMVFDTIFYFLLTWINIGVASEGTYAYSYLYYGVGLGEINPKGPDPNIHRSCGDQYAWVSKWNLIFKLVYFHKLVDSSASPAVKQHFLFYVGIWHWISHRGLLWNLGAGRRW